MIQSWVDTHAHLADEALFEQSEEILSRAYAAGVDRILSVAVDRRSTMACIELAANHRSHEAPTIWATAGVHPNYAHQTQPGDWDDILLAARNPKVCALGETGLDKYWDDCPFPVQLDNFERHWEASRQLDLPVIVHMRDCEPEMLEFLRGQVRQGPLKGVMHSFSGSAAAAEEFIAMGMHISFSGILTYKKNSQLREIASSVPKDRVLVETDCPYLSPEPKRSVRPNQPAMVLHTAQVLAECLQLGMDELSQITTRNALKLFCRMA